MDPGFCFHHARRRNDLFNSQESGADVEEVIKCLRAVKSLKLIAWIAIDEDNILDYEISAIMQKEVLYD